MNRNCIRYLFVVVVSTGLMAPAHAFDFSGWFYSLSNRSKNSLYVATAAVVAGLGFLAYKMCWKTKAQPHVAPQQKDIVQSEPVRPSSPTPGQRPPMRP